MRTFNVNRLPELTRSTYESQQRWGDKNWKDTLKKHYKEIEKLLQKIGVFDSWKNILGNKYGKVAGELVPEIFLDAYISVHFACMGLYKQANICLRTQLETALRLVFFSMHPVEFKWWYESNEWYRGSLRTKDVWGDGYRYFEQLETVKKFDKICNGKLFNSIRRIYKILSRYVHSGVLSFQTTPVRVSPKYKIDAFRKWRDNFRDVQDYVNTIFSLGFADEFQGVSLNNQKKILKVVRNDKFKRGLRKSLGLKFRGRI